MVKISSQWYLLWIKINYLKKHVVYDGVYASKEERIRGGGCLDIRKHVSELLKLGDNELTGN